jgi:Domain of unknown function (DUF4411)
LLYLLDADTLITGDRRAYPLRRFPVFWEWLRHQGTLGNVKIPLEQFEEVTSGRGDIVDWLCTEDCRAALILAEDLDPALVADTTLQGYGPLDENGVELVGRDPFLVAYGRVEPGERTVVSFEVSKPGKQGANRKVPDVCRDFGVPCCSLFDMIEALDFTTAWQQP